MKGKEDKQALQHGWKERKDIIRGYEAMIK